MNCLLYLNEIFLMFQISALSLEGFYLNLVASETHKICFHRLLIWKILINNQPGDGDNHFDLTISPIFLNWLSSFNSMVHIKGYMSKILNIKQFQLTRSFEWSCYFGTGLHRLFSGRGRMGKYSVSVPVNVHIGCVWVSNPGHLFMESSSSHCNS